MNDAVCNSPMPPNGRSATMPGITLMEMLPPVGWADVATKQDLLVARITPRCPFELFEARLEARFERGFRQILVTMTSLLIGGFLATIAATVAAALIR